MILPEESKYSLPFLMCIRRSDFSEPSNDPLMCHLKPSIHIGKIRVSFSPGRQVHLKHFLIVIDPRTLLKGCPQSTPISREIKPNISIDTPRRWEQRSIFRCL